MHLLIRAVSLAGQPLTQAISAYFDERGGTIGRSDTNTLALPDPERRISRLQAEVSRGPEGWRLLNVGNANPIWHNNRPVPPGEAVLLDENDELQIGTYALQVTYSSNDETARTITKGRAAVDARTVIVGSGQEPRTDPSLMQGSSSAAERASVNVAPAASGSSPFADLLGGLSNTGNAPASPAFGSPAAPSSSPFADLFGASSPAPAPSPAPSPAPAGVSRLPDDFDPFADLAPAQPVAGARGAAPQGGWDLPAAPAKAASASPFDLGGAPASLPQGASGLDLLGAVAPAGSAANGIDQLFGLGGGAATDPLAAFLKQTEPAAPAEAPAGMPSQIDPLALVTPRAEVTVEPAAVPPAATLPDDVPEIHAAMPLPPVVEARATTREPVDASFAFMPPPKAAPAAAAPVRSSLLDDLDLSPQTIPSVHIARPRPETPQADLAIDLDVPVGHAPLSAPIETQLPIPQTSVPAVPPVREAVVDEAPAVSAPVVAVPDAPAVASAPAAAPVGAVSAADAQALWAAFCEGAGIHFAPPQGLNPDLMRVIGQLLHHAVDGSLKLVAARAATKQEMRAEVTVIQARRNNPLKFSPDTQSAMEQLLQPPLRGFMSGPEAVADAMDDLLGHTIGTMVGMRAALEGVLARFEPAQLEAKLVGRSMLDSLLPMNRRAKLWELYLQHFDAVKAEAQDDFHNLFGRAFLQAYEEQLDRLDAERRQKANPGRA
jgi:FHA domain-containing protein